jgi:predicted AAA+ superfamily ATPase
VVAALNTQEVYFWATQGGAVLDLLFFSGGRRFGVECTFNESPKITRSMQSALADLSLDDLWVVYPGAVRYVAHEKITMLPLAEVAGLHADISK